MQGESSREQPSPSEVASRSQSVSPSLSVTRPLSSAVRLVTDGGDVDIDEEGAGVDGGQEDVATSLGLDPSAAAQRWAGGDLEFTVGSALSAEDPYEGLEEPSEMSNPLRDIRRKNAELKSKFRRDTRKSQQVENRLRESDARLMHQFVQLALEGPSYGASGVWTRRSTESYFVPRLTSLCAKALAENFLFCPDLHKLDGACFEEVVNHLSTALPLVLAVSRVHSQSYWKRCCHDRWPAGRVPPTNDWKKLYLELHMRDFLEGCGYNRSEFIDRFRAECDLAKDIITKLTCGQLKSHLDSRLIFSCLPNIQELSLTFGAHDYGEAFKLEGIGMNNQDALNLASVLATNHTLKILRVPENLITDAQLRALLSGLVRNRSVTLLDFSHNKIGDDGAKALASLLRQPEGSSVKHLILSDNHIGAQGARHLGRALQECNTLESLSLRLNRIGDEGGVRLCRGLVKNQGLQRLSLAGNSLEFEFAAEILPVLRRHPTLTALDVSSNGIPEEGGAEFTKAVVKNECLLAVDVRYNEFSAVDIQILEDLVKERQNRRGATVADLFAPLL